MAGGLMNLVAYGNQNIILNGNPSKTFFKFTYCKYTNFGLQKFRLDINGQRILNMTQESFFTFKVPRYGDLLMDTYLVVNLPNIWSPIIQPKELSGSYNPTEYEYSQWRPYEFKWIDNIGSQIIKEVSFKIGGQIIQKFTGNYMYNLVERDFNDNKKALYYEMTGNIPEINDPANCNNNNGYYPNAYHTEEAAGAAPSINARTLYIPINIWFTLASQMAFPLVSLQYNQLEIHFTLRAVDELFVVRDVTNTDNYWKIPKNIPDDISVTAISGNIYTNSLDKSIKAPYVKPEQNIQAFKFYRFLYQPFTYNLNTIDINHGEDNFPNKRTDWNADIHIISTYGFLGQEEVRVFAAKPQNYLIKEVYEWNEYNISNTKKISIDSLGLVSNWMFYLQRTDISLRNEWSNYSNWPYKYKPYGIEDFQDVSGHFPETGGSWNVIAKPDTTTGPATNRNKYTALFLDSLDPAVAKPLGGQWFNLEKINPGTNPGSFYNDSKIKYTGTYKDDNIKDILVSAGILLDGKYRENILPRGIYNYIEKYTRTFGYAKDSGLNCYNFALHSNPFDFQPSGAINLSKFNSIQFEIQVITPPLDNSAQTLVICDACYNMIGINKPVWNIYKYTYNFICMEERYNILKFINGNAALAYAR